MHRKTHQQPQCALEWLHERVQRTARDFLKTHTTGDAEWQLPLPLFTFKEHCAGKRPQPLDTFEIHKNKKIKYICIVPSFVYKLFAQAFKILEPELRHRRWQTSDDTTDSTNDTKAGVGTTGNVSWFSSFFSLLFLRTATRSCQSCCSSSWSWWQLK